LRHAERGARLRRIRRSAGIASLAALGLFGGCTSRQVYDAGTGWRQNECNRRLDPGERARCLETANKDYDAYRKEKQER
jgi:hypothetical protein